MARPATPGSVPPGRRGALRIADRVFTKIASQAAQEALPDAAGDAPAPVVRRLPQASVSVSARRGTARVRLQVELGYPLDLGAAGGSVRRHVAARVEELTGMRVPEVTVEVARLHSSVVRQASEGRVT
ncbi:Asp23/Gls24 family envelope stress response protein [Streptomyces sp. NPDC018031]|uniref:Asp23/Gls24 family envelope stress response protein n=1 Tax=Streptomyces sp. NPDC018031 TaxID=3365033 RepID=UPI00379AA3B0